MNFMSAVKAMIGDVIPIITLDGMRYGNVEYTTVAVNRMSDALISKFRNFAHIYAERLTRDNYTIEDVFHDTVLHNFKDVARIDGVDIVYDDITIHIRIVPDKLYRKPDFCEYIVREDYIISNDCSTTVVHFDKYRTDSRNEYWEYIVTM